METNEIQQNKTLYILYATKTGNSKDVAKKAKKYFEKKEIKSKTIDLSRFKTKDLSDIEFAFFIVSTYGKGEPPESAKKFFRKIYDKKMVSLPKLRYSVCAMGDSSYKNFCLAGQNLDKQLEKLGAIRLSGQVNCDLDYTQTSKKWIKDIYKQLSKTQN